MTTRCCYIISWGVLLAGCVQAEEPKVQELETVKYQQLTELIAAQKGKVVLVDFWGDFCPPCKREFPNFLRVHEKYRERGLSAISVSLDDAEDAGARGLVRKFLKAQNATTRNLILAEKVEFWQGKLKIDGPPCVFLFDRQGRLVTRWANEEIDYQKIEKRVGELIGK